MQGNGFTINPTTFPASHVTSISQIINFGIPMATTLAALGFGAMLMYAAFLWLTAGDKKDNVAKAWKIMTFGVLGLLLVLFAFVIVRVIMYMFGLGDQLPT